MGNVPIQIRRRKQRLPLDSQHLLISALLPASVKEFMRELEQEVTELCGPRYAHGKANQRWGTQNGSIVLANLQSRDLSAMDVRAVFIDGKRFRKHGVIIALGVAHNGRKFVLGIYQADTENSSSSLELSHRRRHATREEMEVVGAFSTMARHVSSSFGKPNAAPTRSYSNSSAVGPASLAYRLTSTR